MNNISISVLVPCYNHSQYVGDTIKSIWNQDIKDIEIIAIDDGSSDETLSVLRDLEKESPLNMSVYTQKNQGIVKTLNRALNLSKGKYITLIGSDDKYFENSFGKLFSMLEKDTNLKAIYANGLGFEEDKVSSDKVHSKYSTTLLENNTNIIYNRLLTEVPRPLLTQCAIFEKDMLIEVNGWDEELRLDDWPLNIRIFKYLSENGFTHKYIDHNMTYYRSHSTQINKNHIKMFQMIKEVILKYTPMEKRGEFFSFEAINHAKTLLKMKHNLDANRLLLEALKYRPSVKNILKVIRIAIKYNIKSLF